MALRRAIVTGGSAGIGAEVCRQLLATGYEVISLARRSGDIRDPQFSAIEVDLSDAAATRQVVFDLARKCNAWSIEHIANRFDGKVREQVELTPNHNFNIRYESYEEARAALLEEGINIDRLRC